eukprot:ANDGO_05056.mRNA.1 hypothetical protein
MTSYAPLDIKSPNRRKVAVAGGLIFLFAAIGTLVTVSILGSESESFTSQDAAKTQALHSRLHDAVQKSPSALQLNDQLLSSDVSTVFSKALGSPSMSVTKPSVQLIQSAKSQQSVVVSGSSVFRNIHVDSTIQLTFVNSKLVVEAVGAVVAQADKDAIVHPEVRAENIQLRMSRDGTLSKACMVSFGGSKVEASAPFESSNLRFPLPDITIGKVKLTKIDATIQKSPLEFSMTAVALVLFPDAEGRDLQFDVSGTVGKDILQFSGSQDGQWSLSEEVTLEKLAISYDSTKDAGLIQGGVGFGKWALVLQFDFSKSQDTTADIAFVLMPEVGSSVQLSGLPGSAAVADPSGFSVSNAAVVIANYAGSLAVFSTGSLSFVDGVTITCEASLDAASLTLTGTYIPKSKSFELEGDFSNFVLGKDLTLTGTKFVVQSPAQPVFSIQSALTWGSLTVNLVGTFSNSDIVFAASTMGTVWHIPVGKDGIDVQNVQLNVDYHRQTKTTSADVQGSVVFGQGVTLNVDMKYPADSSSAPGCYALTVSTSTQLSVSNVLGKMLSSNDIASAYVEDVQELFAASLESMTFTIWPNCDFVSLDGVIATKVFGNSEATITVQKYAGVGQVVDSIAANLKTNPSVTVSPGVTSTVKDALAALSGAISSSQVSTVFAISQLSDVAMSTVVPELVSSLPSTLLVPFPGNAEVSASQVLDAIEAFLPVGTRVTCDVSGDWHFEFHVKPVSQQYPINTPPGLHLTSPSFALTSASMALTLDITFIAKQGLNFNAELDVAHSTHARLQKLATYMAAGCQSVSYEIQGSITKTAWSVAFEIPKGCISLNHDEYELSAVTVQIQDSEPQLTVDSTLMVVKQNYGFAVSGTVDDKGFTLNGQSDGTIQLNVGHDPLTVDSLSITVSDESGTFDTDIKGSVTINEHAHFSVESKVDSASGFYFSGQLSYDQGYAPTLADLVDRLLGSASFQSDIPMPNDFRSRVSAVQFIGGDVTIQSQPPTFKLDGKVSAFGEELDFSLSYTNGQFAFAISFALKPNFQFSDIFPDIKSLDDLKTMSPAVIIANAESEMNLPGGSISYSASQGLNFVAGLQLDPTKHAQAQIGKWTGKDEFLIEGVIVTETNFKLVADAQVDFTLFHRADMADAGVFFAIDGTDVKVGIDGKLTFSLSSRADDDLSFFGDLFVDEEGAGFDAGMTTPWSNPFGIPGVTLDQCEVSLTLSPVFVPTQFGISGGLKIGSVGGDALVYADVGELQKSVLAAAVENIRLGDITESIFGHSNVPETLAKTVFDVSMQDADVSINFSGEDLEFDGKTYDQGFKLDVDMLDLWEIIKGSAHVDIDPSHGVSVSGSMDPVHFGDVLDVSEVQLDIVLMNNQPPRFGFDGAVSILGASMAADIQLSDTSAMVYVEFKLGSLLDFLMNCSAAGSDFHHPTDFSVLAELNDGLLDWVSTKIPEYAQQAKADADSAFDKVLADLQDKKNSLDSISAEIDAIKAQDQRDLSAAEQKFLDAKADVVRFQSHVDELQSSINADEDARSHCKWYQLTCKGWYDVKIAALWVAKHVADGVLEVAVGVLDVAEAALEKIPEVDPRVLTLEAERGVALAAISVAEAAVEAAESVTNMIDNTISWVARGLGKVFNIEHALLSGSLSKIKAGDLADVQLEGYFLGKHVDFNVDINLQLLDNFAADIWHALMKMF